MRCRVGIDISCKPRLLCHNSVRTRISAHNRVAEPYNPVSDLKMVLLDTILSQNEIIGVIIYGGASEGWPVLITPVGILTR